MSLNPPAHICGPMSNYTRLPLRQERWRWVQSMSQAGYTHRAIAASLGIGRGTVGKVIKGTEPYLSFTPRSAVVVAPEPEVIAQAPAPARTTAVVRDHGPTSRTVPISLARAPWDGDILPLDPRPETALPRGIVSPPRAPDPWAEVINAIRQVRDEARAQE